MNFQRIREAIGHYESIRARLLFHVREVKPPQGKGPPTFHAEPLSPSMAGNTNYSWFEGDREAAQRLVDEYNARAEAFLRDEYEHVRQVLLAEAGEQRDDG